eukprot:15476413-Alexandrium_andersonii.AAC.1
MSASLVGSEMCIRDSAEAALRDRADSRDEGRQDPHRPDAALCAHADPRGEPRRDPHRADAALRVRAGSRHRASSRLADGRVE